MLSIDLHVNLHVQGAAGAASPPVCFTCTFEDASDALAALPRMFIEPDGAFVWVSSNEPAWQLDGVLYDGAESLWYVELKGRCREADFDRFLRALGWPQTLVAFQLVREAEWLNERDFRRYAGWTDPPDAVLPSAGPE
ncbi:MAG TPA: hypothetical protein VFI31_25450 [Pirellulales bacterium]|nr:hypothetical protein [Pirellulales bacterium]